MEIKDRINAVEADLQQTKDELKDILFAIRTCLTEVRSPTPNNPDKEKHRAELKSRKGVTPNGI